MGKFARLAAQSMRCEAAVVVRESTREDGDCSHFLVEGAHGEEILRKELPAASPTAPMGVAAGSELAAFFAKALATAPQASVTLDAPDASSSFRFRVAVAVPTQRDDDAPKSTAGQGRRLLCVLDPHPRTEPPDETDALETLRTIAELISAHPTPHPAHPDRGGATAAAAAAAAVVATEAATPPPSLSPSAITNVISEHSFDMISVHDTSPEGRYLYASPACFALLGYTPAELLGRPAYQFFHPDDLKASMELHNEVLDEVNEVGTVKRKCDPLRLQRKDGSYVHCNVSTQACEIGLVCVTRDDTERHALEVELRKHVSRYELLARHCADMISLHAHSSGLEFQFASSACRVLFGYDAADLLGRSIFELVHPDDLIAWHVVTSSLGTAAAAAAAAARARRRRQQ